MLYAISVLKMHNVFVTRRAKRMKCPVVTQIMKEEGVL